MPLLPDPSGAIDDSNLLMGVRFMMKNGKERVVCIVSYEALQDRAAADKTNEDSRETFLRHRHRIYQIASDLFDEGNTSPKVLSEMLTP